MIKELAEKQWDKANYEGDTDNAVGFEHKGQFIINPWVDPSGRFNLSTPGAIETYGIDNFSEFCGKAVQGTKGDRVKALAICYEIPQYDELRTRDKNAIYDKVMEAIR